MFNVMFSSLPIILYGLWEQDVSADISMENPELYKSGPQVLCSLAVLTCCTLAVLTRCAHTLTRISLSLCFTAWSHLHLRSHGVHSHSACSHTLLTVTLLTITLLTVTLLSGYSLQLKKL